MREETRRAVDQWWGDVFDVRATLWSAVTVLHPHGRLGDYPGWYVAWRATGVHVSAPSSADAEEVRSLRQTPLAALREVKFWDAFAKQRGLDVVGPAVHRYLDADPGDADGVREVEPSSLHPLRDRVTDEGWWESGFDEALDEAGVVAFATDDAAAVLRDLADAPRNVALLVASEARGRGLGTAVGRAAAAHAVRHHGYARWRSRDTNVASTRAAQRLGFEAYATQLAVRPASGS